ncbi:MAG: AEC family transporter [Clostridia bacterium]|nr:AEC family transporter [Oscillospiraceae bacterium]MBR6747942.1 AEC family transporter [Clostridia bacterium]
MLAVLVKALSFVLIIAGGYALKKVGFFKKEDFKVLSRIVLSITLPCAVVSNFNDVAIEGSMVILVVLGILGNLLLVAAGYLAARKNDPDDKAFRIQNTAGYNIGCFTMPFVQGFLGPIGVITACLFDAGNSMMCNGGTYAMASVAGGKTRARFSDFAKKMLSSVAFDAYCIMLILRLLNLRLPDAVITFTDIGAGANGFMAMLMIGVGFELSPERDKILRIISTLAIRFSLMGAAAAIAWFFAPFAEEIRQVLAMVCLSPVSSAAVAYTGKLDNDVGTAGVVNSLSIVISVICITALMLVRAA